MKQNIVALIAGLLFGAGLIISQMIDPVRSLGFFDVAGRWDPTLLFVLGGAVGVTLIAFRFVLRQPAPFFAPKFQLPTKTTIDRPLIVGSALFGVGWAIAGYCPGPGITALIFGSWNPVLFVGSMAVGSFLYSRVSNRVANQITEPSSATTETSRTMEIAS